MFRKLFSLALAYSLAFGPAAAAADSKKGPSVDLRNEVAVRVVESALKDRKKYFSRSLEAQLKKEGFSPAEQKELLGDFLRARFSLSRGPDCGVFCVTLTQPDGKSELFKVASYSADRVNFVYKDTEFSWDEATEIRDIQRLLSKRQAGGFHFSLIPEARAQAGAAILFLGGMLIAIWAIGGAMEAYRGWEMHNEYLKEMQQLGGEFCCNAVDVVLNEALPEAKKLVNRCMEDMTKVFTGEGVSFQAALGLKSVQVVMGKSDEDPKSPQVTVSRQAIWTLANRALREKMLDEYCGSVNASYVDKYARSRPAIEIQNLPKCVAKYQRASRPGNLDLPQAYMDAYFQCQDELAGDKNLTMTKKQEIYEFYVKEKRPAFEKIRAKVNSLENRQQVGR